jgi:hypothetical protein
MHLIILLVDEAQVEVILVHLKIVLILTQDRCTVCVECTIGLEIVLDPHPMELLGDMGHVESRIRLFGDGVKFGVR